MNATRKPALDWIASQQDVAAERLIRWCDQNSWSNDLPNLRLMAQMLATDFRSFGVDFEAIDLPPLKLLGDDDQWKTEGTGPGLLWHHNPNADHRVLLMIHYDTVYPPNSQPAAVTRVAGDASTPAKLIGPGVADAKGGIAVIAMAVEAMLRFNLIKEIGVSVFLNPDEEIGSTASSDWIRQLAGQFSYGLVFEPTLPDGSLVAARKGSGNFAIHVRGRSAHAGRNIDDGRNAIVHLAKIVDEVSQLHGGDAGTTVNVGEINGGGPLNRVPDLASAKMNFRVTDQPSMARVQSQLKSIARRFTADGFVVSCLGEFHSPPKIVGEEIDRLQMAVAVAGESVGRSIAWRDTGGACDGSKLAAWGLPNIDTMSVTGGNLHSPEEYMELDSLPRAAATVVTMICGARNP